MNWSFGRGQSRCQGMTFNLGLLRFSLLQDGALYAFFVFHSTTLSNLIHFCPAFLFLSVACDAWDAPQSSWGDWFQTCCRKGCGISSVKRSHHCGWSEPLLDRLLTGLRRSWNSPVVEWLGLAWFGKVWCDRVSIRSADTMFCDIYSVPISHHTIHRKGSVSNPFCLVSMQMFCDGYNSLVTALGRL